MDLIDIKTLDTLIEEKLEISIDEFKTKHILSLKIGVHFCYDYPNKNIASVYKYYLFACYLIKQEIKEHDIIKFCNVFDYDKKEFSLIIYYDRKTLDDIFNVLSSNMYGVNIIKRKIITDLSDINEKDIKQLIVEKFDMSIEEFEKIPLGNLPINFQEITHFCGEDTEYKYFKVANHFIELYLSALKDFNIYSKRIFDDFKPEMKKINKYEYELTGNIMSKNIYCVLVNAPKELIELIPKKLLDIDIIIKNRANHEIKIDFKHGTFNNKRGIINFDAEIKINYSNILLSILNRNLVVSYYGNFDDEHEISYTDDSIIFTVTEKHIKGSNMRYLCGTRGNKMIPNRKYKYIILRHHHEMEI